MHNYTWRRMTFLINLMFSRLRKFDGPIFEVRGDVYMEGGGGGGGANIRGPYIWGALTVFYVIQFQYRRKICYPIMKKRWLTIIVPTKKNLKKHVTFEDKNRNNSDNTLQIKPTFWWIKNFLALKKSNWKFGINLR